VRPPRGLETHVASWAQSCRRAGRVTSRLRFDRDHLPVEQISWDDLNNADTELEPRLEGEGE